MITDLWLRFYQKLQGGSSINCIDYHRCKLTHRILKRTTRKSYRTNYKIVHGTQENFSLWYYYSCNRKKKKQYREIVCKTALQVLYSVLFCCCCCLYKNKMKCWKWKAREREMKRLVVKRDIHANLQVITWYHFFLFNVVHALSYLCHISAVDWKPGWQFPVLVGYIRAGSDIAECSVGYWFRRKYKQW